MEAGEMPGHPVSIPACSAGHFLWRAIGLIAPVVRGQMHFYSPFSACTLPMLEFLQVATVFGFQPGQTKKRDFFLLNGISVGFCWMESLILLTGPALDTLRLLRTLNPEHTGLLVLLNLFPYPEPEDKLHPPPYPQGPFNLWIRDWSQFPANIPPTNYYFSWTSPTCTFLPSILGFLTNLVIFPSACLSNIILK